MSESKNSPSPFIAGEDDRQKSTGSSSVSATAPPTIRVDTADSTIATSDQQQHPYPAARMEAVPPPTRAVSVNSGIIEYRKP